MHTTKCAYMMKEFHGYLDIADNVIRMTKEISDKLFEKGILEKAAKVEDEIKPS
ncbi:MAG: hypothetical protein ACRCST_05385 [Turicibacter sp.]